MIKRVLGWSFIILFIIYQLSMGSKILAFAGKHNYNAKGITITDKGKYFDVLLDFTSGLTHRQMGEAFAKALLQVIPNYQVLIDSYIAENITKYEYPYLLFRVEDVRLQLKEEYKEEIEGMSSVLCQNNKNIWHDNRLSKDELYTFNLFPDTVRSTQCSFVSVYGSRSSTGKTIMGRNLDWYGGSKNQLPQIQAVITLKYQKVRVCSIGYLGFMGILSGFNDNKIFAAIMDSTSGAAYDSIGKRSYPFDLREALESQKSLATIANFMKDPEKHYTVNHIIAFSDPIKSIILENNFSGDSTQRDRRVKRMIREANSRLNWGISWGISNAIGSVNSFLLVGNNDNHSSNKFNTKRWKNMRNQLLSKGSTVTPQELKEIMEFKHGRLPGTFMDSGDLYNRMTLQMILFQPDNLSLEIFFHSKYTLNNPKHPIFKKIPVFQ